MSGRLAFTSRLITANKLSEAPRLRAKNTLDRSGKAVRPAATIQIRPEHKTSLGSPRSVEINVVRIIKIILIVLVGLWGFIGGLGNLALTDSGFTATAEVVGAAGRSGVADWQRIENPLLIWAAWALLPIGKLATAALCFFGAWRMCLSRHSPADQFNTAKAFGLLGCGIAIAMMFGIFMVAADTYFKFWQAELGSRVMPIAFRYVGSIGIIALFVNQPDR